MTRESSIIELAQWLKSPPGRYLLGWEQVQLDRHVSDLFGFHALQLGLPQLDGLRANRMPHRWVASDSLFMPEPYELPLRSWSPSLSWPRSQGGRSELGSHRSSRSWSGCCWPHGAFGSLGAWRPDAPSSRSLWWDRHLERLPRLRASSTRSCGSR